MPITSNTIVNRAINIIGGNQQAVTGEYPAFDDSTAGTAANALYQGVVQTAARKFGFDFARNLVVLTLTGNGPPIGWAYEYAYPSSGVQIRQVMPAAQPDLNDPVAVNWSVGNVTVGGTPTKVIWTDVVNAKAWITNQPPESLWDALFIEEVVRLLASEMAQAIEGKPETAQANLESSAAFGQLGQTRDS